MKIPRSLALLAALSLAATWTQAQTLPDFTGKWKQDNARSTPPISEVHTCAYTITLHDADLKIDIATSSNGGRLTSGLMWTENYTIGSHKLNVERGRVRDRTTSVEWAGNQLAFQIVVKESGATTTTEETWSLSDDGQTLIRDQFITNPGGTTERKSLVFVKQ